MYQIGDTARSIKMFCAVSKATANSGIPPFSKHPVQSNTLAPGEELSATASSLISKWWVIEKTQI